MQVSKLQSFLQEKTEKWKKVRYTMDLRELTKKSLSIYI